VTLVRAARTDIQGVLNAIRVGTTGGNVWFANPPGFLVGKPGLVNVRRLHVTAPAQEFRDGLVLSPGHPDAGAVEHLPGGTAPRSGTGVISIQGKVNAADGVELSAGTINVAGSLYSGARFVGTAPDFTDVVNVNGLESGTDVVMKEGRIQIVADGDVAVSGTLSATGGPGVNGGEI